MLQKGVEHTPNHLFWILNHAHVHKKFLSRQMRTSQTIYFTRTQCSR